MRDKTTRELGLETRRAVLGHDYVDRALAQATDFSRELQELVTDYCWGEVWSRPGLDRRTRSLLNIAMLTALGKQHELKTHVLGALTNGVSVRELQETLLQTAVYCGLPAALEAQRSAEQVLIEQGVELE
jgi:4-carboxymuconolactone decarboxylase